MSKNYNKEQSLVNDQMRSDTMNKLSTTCGTDMFPGMFAMETKLVRSSERNEYVHKYDRENEENKENIETDSVPEKLDDVTDNYKNSGKVPSKIFQSQHSEYSDVKEPVRGHKHDEHKHESAKSAKSNKSTDEQSYKNTTTSAETDTKNTKEGKNGILFNENDESTWSNDELMLRKLEMFRKLGELTQCGVKLSRNYSLESEYKDMKFEHDLHVGIRAKKTAITWMSKAMITIVQGIEMANDGFNPFDMKFETQWSSSVTQDIKDYYDVLGDIYEKYSTPGKKMSPELKLFLMLSGSAVTIQLFKGANSTTKELEKDTDLIKSLRTQAQKDTQENSDNNSKKSEKSSGHKNRQALQEMMDKEHEEAIKKATDLKFINDTRKEYEKYQNMMQGNNMAKFSNDVLLSDTIGSIKSVKSAKSNKKNDTDSIDKVMNFQEYTKQLKLNKELSRAQELMKSLQEEEKIVNQFETPRPEILKPPRVLKSMENNKTKPIKLKSTSSSDSASNNTSNSTSNSTSSVSIASSSSSVSIRSDKSLKKLLDNIPGMKVDIESSKSNKSSINIDSDEIRKSNMDMKNKNSEKSKKASDKELTFEAISLGKASNDSGNTSKRGRPRKNQPLKIQTSK